MTSKLAVQELLGDHPTIWVFGYGSLLWKPDFRYKSKQIGYIEDYERRFYQGNITFRGKPGQPGRVANLVEQKGGQAWGVAYEISGRDEVTDVLQALYARETSSGGYVTMVTTFYPREEKNTTSRPQPAVPAIRLSPAGSNESGNDFSDTDSDSNDSSELFQQYLSVSSMRRVESDMSIGDSTSDEGSEDDSDADQTEEGQESEHPLHSDAISQHRENSNTPRELQAKDSNASYRNKSVPRKQPIQVLLYTVTPDNDLYLGPDDITAMAKQIVHASGHAGTNVEYVTKIADYVRRYIPEDEDHHLFQLDAKIREEVYNLYAKDPSRLHASLTDLIHEFHEPEHESLIEPVMAS